MKALCFSSFGGPDVLEYLELQIPVLNQDDVLVRMQAIGLNYADIYRRKGNYHLKGNPPFIAGYEGAGVVEVSNSPLFKIGDRVAFADVPFANAEFVAAPASHLISLPQHISCSLAASVLLQGLTAHYLATDSHSVSSGELVLVHAAAGGVGQILTQICKLKGARVIGLSRSESKIQTILDCKADFALGIHENWKKAVWELSENQGVDVVFDSVGSSLMESIEMAKSCGHIVFYGMSGGDPIAVDPRLLMDSSKTLTGGDLWSYLTSSDERNRRANQLFSWIEAGEIKIKDPVQFKLSEGRRAHDFLESGESAGKVLLIPDGL